MNKIMSKAIYIIPFIVLTMIAFLVTSMVIKNLYPRISYYPSALPELEMREFSMVGESGQSNDIINFSKVPKQPYILNIFNSTCSSCIEEHPQLMDLADNYDTIIYGVAYNDNVKSLRKFLTDHGNPYKRVAITDATYDFKGLNITSTPVSLLIDIDGKIRYRHNGIISPKILEELIVPMMEEIDGLESCSS